MSDRPDSNHEKSEIDLARRIDMVCRHFEADCRAGRQPRLEDYLGEVPERCRAALRSELESLLAELRPPEGPETDPSTGTGRPPSTIAESPTIAPRAAAAQPSPGEAHRPVREKPTVPPSAEATLNLEPSAFPSSEPASPTHIRYFGDYEIIREIARGGMGVVFEARQVSLNRKVALKMILAGQLANETDVKRFHTEAEAAANLDHPGVVPIYEVGQHDGQHYFSMGFVEGQSLSSRLAEGPLPPREAAALMVNVAEAIEFAHQRDVIHRDLKPANILLDKNGNPRVTDFGLAKKLQSDSGLTGSGQIMGTPSYMPPEQAGGQRGEVGATADVYALGATLYALVTGRPPFQATTPMETLIQLLSDEPVPPRRLNASIPIDLETICLKCLQKEPGKRYAGAAALRDDLKRCLAGEPIRARPVTRFERAVKWARRRPVVAVLGAAVVLLSVIGLTGIAWQWREAVSARIDAQAQARSARASAAEARQRLRESLIGQGRAERLGGARWSGIKALGDAAKIKASEDLRQEAIQAITAAGARLDREIHFGQAYLMHFSSDGSLLAVYGTHHGEPNDRGDRSQVIVYRVADGQQVDRIELGGLLPFVNGHDFEFRPGSATLFYMDRREGRGGVHLRDVARNKDVGFYPDHFGVSYSPDGAKLVELSHRRLRVLNADDVHEEHSRPADRLLGFPSNDEVMIEGGRTIKGWNLRTGRETFTFAIPQGLTLVHATYGRNGPLVLLFDKATFRNASLWDVRAGVEISRLDDVAPEPYDVRRTSPGALLAFDAKDRPGVILLYDWVRRMPRGRLDGVVSAGGNFNMEQRSALSPDGRLLAAYARRHATRPTIHVWDVETGQKAATLRDCAIPTWSPDGRRLAAIGRSSGAWTSEGWVSGDNSSVKLWEVASPIATYRQNRPVALITAPPDGRRLAVDDEIWEVIPSAGSRHLSPLPRPVPAPLDFIAFAGTGALRAARFSKDTDLFKKRFGQPIPLWQIEPHAREWELPTIERQDGASYWFHGRVAVFSPDGRYLAMLGRRWSITGESLGESFAEQANLWNLAIPAQVQVLYKGPFDKVVFQEDPNAPAGHGVGHYRWVGSGHWSANWGDNPRQLAFSPDSRMLAIANNTGVVLYRVSDGRPFRRLENGEHPQSGHTRHIATHCAAFSPDGGWVCYGGEEGRLNIGTIAPSPDEPPVVFIEAGKLGEVAPSSDQRRIIVIRQPGDETPQVISTDPRITWKGHEGTVLALAISPDGRTLATGGEDRMIRLWELPSTRPLARWEAHDANVTALAFLHDGTIISGDAEGMLKLWDVAMIRRELAAMGLDW
jgi:WD40 repeat protein